MEMYDLVINLKRYAVFSRNLYTLASTKFHKQITKLTLKLHSDYNHTNSDTEGAFPDQNDNLSLGEKCNYSLFKIFYMP